MKQKREKRTMADVPDLHNAIDYCNKYKLDHRGALAQARIKVKATNAQVSHVLSGVAPYTSRNLDILIAVYTYLKTEVEAMEKKLDFFRQIPKNEE